MDGGTGRTASSRAGFTMVELMIVVAIIGMMTVTVSTSIESMLPGERLNTTIRNLSADLRSIRSEAISRGAEFRLIYDLDNERYRWSTPLSLDEGLVRQETGENWEDADRIEFSWEDLAEGVEFSTIFVAGEPHTTGEVFVSFDPIGTATDHSVIMSQPRYSRSFTIEVMALTGLVHMHDGEFFREPPTDGDFK